MGAYMTKKLSISLISAVTILAISSFQTIFADEKRDDGAIANEVKAKITEVTKVNSATSPFYVVNVKDGKVKIYGIVNTKEQKKDAEKSIKEIKGVNDVDTEIMVIE